MSATDAHAVAVQSRPAGLRTASRAIWITWDHHRRTTELARALGVPLEEIVLSAARPVRYVVLGIATIRALRRKRPRLVIVQNPSIFLAALVCALKNVLGFKVVVDRHSNFEFENTDSGLFNLISNFSLRRADLTIVTNEQVRNLVEEKGGQGFVLPDKLPAMSTVERPSMSGRFNVVFVCTYSADEPIAEVIEAARLLPPDVHIHITGNDRKLAPSIRQSAPANAVFTGFLSAEDYESLLATTDVVLELTTRENTLLCGAYEAVSLGKPLIISRTDALTTYFRKGAIVTDNTAKDIAAAVQTARGDMSRLRVEMASLADELSDDWTHRFDRLLTQLEAW